MKNKKLNYFLLFCLVLLINPVKSQDLVDITKGMNYTGKESRSIGISDNEEGTGDGRGWSANLYLPSEILSGPALTNKDNTLTSVRFMIDKAGMADPAGDVVFKDVKIYLFNYGTSTSFSDKLSHPDLIANNATLVFQGDLTVNVPSTKQYCESHVQFQNSFEYKSGNSLVLYIEKNTKQSTGSFQPRFATMVGVAPALRNKNNWRNGCTDCPAFFGVDEINTQNYMAVKFNDNLTAACAGVLPTCNTTFSYPSPTVCKGTTDPIATKSPLNASGIYTSTTGLSIDPITGTINLTKSTPGTYTVTFEESLTCKPTTTITINETPVISDTSITICSGNNFTIVPSNKIKDIVPANTTYTWTHTNNANVTGISDELVGKTSISAPSLTNTSNSAQDVVYQVTPKAGACAGIPFKLTVTIKNKPDKPIFSGITQPTCNSLGSVPLLNYLAPPAIYNFKPSIGVSINSNGKIAAPSGKYKFVVSQDGCNSDSSDLLIMNDVLGKPVIEGPSSVCVGSEITLKAWTDNAKTTKSTPRATSPWSLNVPGDNDTVSVTLGMDATTTSTIIKGLKVASLSKPAEATIIYTDINGCTSEQSVTVNSIPNVSPITGADSVCAANFTTLSNLTPGGSWSSSDPNIGGVTATGDFQTKQAGEVMVYYTVTSSNGCQAIAQKKMIVKVTQDVIFSHNAYVCAGAILQLSPSVKGGIWTCMQPQFGSVSNSMFFPNVNSASNVVSLKYEQGLYSCFNTIYSDVKIHAVPQILGNSTSICVGDTTTFKDIANRDPLNEKTIWSLTNNTVATIDKNGILNAIKDGGSEVMGKNVFGCTSQSYVKIRPAALFDNATINVCSGVEKSFIPIINNSSSSMNPTFKWSVLNSAAVDGESVMQTLVPAFKQILTNKSGNDQKVNYMLTSSVGTGSDACLINRNLIVMVSSALDIVGPSNIDLGNQVQYTSLNKSDNTLKWSTSNPQVIIVDNSGVVASKEVGSAILFVSNAFGCSAEMNVNVTQNQKIQGLNYVCEGSQITLSGFNTPKTVDPWTSSNTSILTINAVGQVTGLKAGKSQVTYYSDQGAKDTLTIVVKATPFVNTITDYSICPGYFSDSIKFNGTPGASFEWKNTNVTSGILPSGLNRIYPFKAINDGSSPINSQISVTPRLGECFGTTKTFNISVRFNPKLVLNQVDTLVCHGGNVNFKTEITPLVDSPTYTWYVNGTKVEANTSVYSSKTLKSKDNITVNVNGKDFCTSTANLSVRMDSLRLRMQVPSMLYVKAPAINLEGYPVGGTFSGKGIVNNRLDPSISGVGNKLITYSFKNTNNCVGQMTQNVMIYDTVSNNCQSITYDTVTITNNVTKYDTVIVKKNVYDTITITNNVTKYDTVKVTVSDTVSILKVKFKLTTGIKANQETTMRVYPNPTSDILRIEVADEKAMAGYAYKIIDAVGKVVYNQPVKAAVTEIPLKTLGALGAYFLEVLDENFKIVVTKKIILE